MTQNNFKTNEKLLDHLNFYWHLELTNKCMLKCPRCPRTEAKGMYRVTEMDLEFIKKIFTPERLKPLQQILLCGGEGDPIYCSDFLKIVKFFKNTKPELTVRIVTNGSYREPWWWRELGSLLNAYDVLTFSIDGWDQASNAIYRVNSNWDSIISGIKNVQPTKAIINWSTIYFKFNQDKIMKIRSLAKNLGFDRHFLVHSLLFGDRINQYIDPNTNTDPLQPSSGYFSKTGRHIKTFEKLSSKEAKKNSFEKIYLQKVKEVEEHCVGWSITPLCKIGNPLYVSAEGYLYPCSWVSHPYNGIKKSKLRTGVSTTWKDSFFVKNREKFNLRTRDVKDVLSDPFWAKCQAAWRSPETIPITCEQKCHSQILIDKRRNKAASLWF